VIGAVVLAAGEGTRFGGPKVLAQHKGIELVRHVVDRLALAGVFDIVVTAGAHRSGIEAALHGSPARVVPVADPSAGLATSLNTGVSALADECRVFVVALGDQPLIDPQLIGRLRAAWEGSNAAAVVPVYHGGVRGHPVLFDISMRRFLRELSGDRGARQLLDEMAERVIFLPVDADAPRDVDSPEDLAALEPQPGG
jgi:CTP:molybdopterin cytidylyltransferase MocA